MVTTHGTVHFYSQKEKKEMWLEGNNDVIYLSLTIRYDSNLFACGQKNGQIDLYDMNKKKILTSFKKGGDFILGHVNRVVSLNFLDDDNNLILSGGCDRMIYLWDIRSKDVKNVN